MAFNLDDLVESTPRAAPPNLDQQVVDQLQQGDLLGGRQSELSAPRQPTMGDTMQSLLPVLGSVLGGAAGAPLGPGSAAGGAGLGYELGDRTMRLGQNLADWILPPQKPGQYFSGGGGTATALGRSMQKPTSLPNELLRTGENIATGAAAEMSGQVIGRGVQGVVTGISKRLPDIAPGARAVQADLASAGGRLTPAQMTESRTLDVIEGIAEGALFGGAIDVVKKGQQTAVQTLVERTLADVDTKMGTRGVAAFLTDAVRGKQLWGKALQRAAYKEVDDVAGVGVNTQEIVGFIEDSLAKNQTNVKRALDAGLPNWRDVLIRPESQATMFRPVGTTATKTVTSPIADAFGRPITSEQMTRGMREVQQVTGVPGANQTTFAEAANARSALLALSRKKSLAPEDEVVTKTAGLLASKLDTAIENATGTLAPQALAAFRDANALTKRVEQSFNNETVRAVVRTLSKQPAKLANVLLTPNNVDVLERVRDAVPGAWPTIQSKLAEISMIRAADVTRQGRFDGNALLKQFKKLGPETVEAAFGKETAAALIHLGETSSFVTRGLDPASQSGALVIKMRQGGAIVALSLTPFMGVPSGLAAAGAVGTLLGPYSMGKILANPRAIRALSDGLQPALSVERAGRIASYLSAYTLTGKARSSREGGLEPSAAGPGTDILDQLEWKPQP